MTAVDASAAFMKADGVECTETPDGYVIYQGDRKRMHHLNPTAAMVFELCDGARTVGEIAAVLQEEFGLPEPPLDAVLTCLRELVDERIVTPCRPPSSAA